MTSYEINEKLKVLKDEILRTLAMDEEAVCEKYNVDRREEAVELMHEELGELLEDYERKVCKEEFEQHRYKESVWSAGRNQIRQLLVNI